MAELVNEQMQKEVVNAAVATAGRLGISPRDVLTVIGYETAGSMDPWQAGPTTQWGQHRGFAQMGVPQREQYGYNKFDTIAQQMAAVERYLVDNGVKPGMGLLDIYSAVNAGEVGLYDRTDENNGGAAGTVRDKVEQQMADEQALADQLMAGYARNPSNMNGFQDKRLSLAQNSNLNGVSKVAQLQEQLASRGYNPGPIDGKMGAQTRAAIAAFQANNGLPPTGQLDETTETAIVTPTAREAENQSMTDLAAMDRRAAEVAAFNPSDRSTWGTGVAPFPSAPAANPSTLGGLNYSFPAAASLPNPSQLGGLNYSVPAAPFSGRASYPETPRSSPAQSAASSSNYPETPRSFPPQSPSYQTDNLASQAMFDALPQDTYFQDKLEKAAKAENDKIGLASRFPGMGDIAERVAPSYPTATGISAAIGGAGRPSAPSVGSMPGTTPAGLGGLNYSVAPASRPAAPPVSAGSARTPAQLGGLNYSVPPATQPSLADQYASYGAGKATTNRAPNDTRASAYRSMPPAPVMAAAIDRIDIPGSAKPAAPAISPSTLAAQYASYGAGKIAPTQTAASATQSAPKPSQAIAQKATPPAMSAAPRAVAPRQVTPYAPPAAPAMTPERAKALGMVPTPGVPGAYMPNVPGNQAQVMADQAKLIAANPIASIGKMLAGTMLGGVFHAGGGLRSAAQNVAQAVGGNRQQSDRDRLANALASVALGGVGGSFTGPGGVGGFNGGGFQAGGGNWGGYGSSGSFNSGTQTGSGFTFDR